MEHDQPKRQSSTTTATTNRLSGAAFIAAGMGTWSLDITTEEEYCDAILIGLLHGARGLIEYLLPSERSRLISAINDTRTAGTSIDLIVTLDKSKPMVQFLRIRGGLDAGDPNKVVAVCFLESTPVEWKNGKSSGKSNSSLNDSNCLCHLEEAIASLCHNERRFEESQKIAQIGSWELNCESKVLSWSNEVFRICELDEKEIDLSFESFLAVVHPADRDLLEETYWNSLATRQDYHLVHRLLMKDGRIKWVEERCSTQFNIDGNPVRV
ncbi:PAS domain-containing protein [Pirellulaceae bacterium SH449]